MGNFFLGLGTGLICGVLFAPKSGSEVRHDIRRKADQGAGYVKGRVDALGSQASHLIERGKEAASEIVGRGRTATTPTTSAIPPM